jgi:hypothetical protein
MDEAVSFIIDKLASWDDIVAEIGSKNGLGLSACKQVEHEVGQYLGSLEDEQKRKLWQETEVGMMHHNDADMVLIDSIIMDLEVALFEAVTNAAWEQVRK